jgi:hypothetical protein
VDVTVAWRVECVTFGYYGWRSRSVSLREENELLLQQIMQVHFDSGGTSGSPRHVDRHLDGRSGRGENVRAARAGEVTQAEHRGHTKDHEVRHAVEDDLQVDDELGYYVE